MSSIKFSCECGQHLKARAESAGRLTMCPRCRKPVAVPKLESNHRGVDELPTSLVGAKPSAKSSASTSAASERSRAASTPASQSRTVETRSPPRRAAVKQSSSAPKGRRRNVAERRSEPKDETIRLRKPPRWKRLCNATPKRGRVDAVEFSLGAFPLVAGVAAGLALACVAGLRVLPGLFGFEAEAAAMFTMIMILAAGAGAYACEFLKRTLSGALDSAATGIKPFDYDPGVALKSFAQWTGCLMSVPVPLLACGVMYWIYCGELNALDYAILVELAVVAIGYGLFAVTVVCKTGRLRDVTPVRVVDEAVAYGPRGLWVVLIVCGVATAHAVLSFQAATIVHESPFSAFLLFLLCWFGALYLVSFTLRLIGQWDYKRRSQVTRTSSGRDATAVCHS